MAGADRRLSDGHGIGAREDGRTPNDLDTERFEAFDGVVRGDRGHDLMDMAMDARPVDPGFAGGDAERGRLALGLGRVAGREQGLGRDAARVEAVAAHGPFFDENDLRPHLGRAGGDAEPARSGADDADIGLDHDLLLALGACRTQDELAAEVGERLKFTRFFVA